MKINVHNKIPDTPLELFSKKTIGFIHLLTRHFTPDPQWFSEPSPVGASRAYSKGNVSGLKIFSACNMNISLCIQEFYHVLANPLGAPPPVTLTQD